jgi:hypothetical protein
VRSDGERAASRALAARTTGLTCCTSAIGTGTRSAVRSRPAAMSARRARCGAERRAALAAAIAVDDITSEQDTASTTTP